MEIKCLTIFNLFNDASKVKREKGIAKFLRLNYIETYIFSKKMYSGDLFPAKNCSLSILDNA